MEKITEKVTINGKLVEIIVEKSPSTKSITCSRCGASAQNSNEINHKNCCPYIGGHGC
jgi:transposase